MENSRANLKVGNEKAILVNLTLPKTKIDPADSLAELEALAQSAGAIIVWKMYQRRPRIHAATFVGKGKAQEISLKVKELGADVVIFDSDLSPGQIRDLEEIIGCKVIDRSELILDIFATRARTHEAKLQVELAQLQYTYPRLTRMWGHLDTVVGAAGGGIGAVGGIGTRGTGEKQLEIDRRLVSKRLTALKRELESIDIRKQREVDSRAEHFTVSLVGYTNAGKSTLMNCLTGSGTFVADQLFATLDTKTARWNLDREHYVLLSDTVGFVRALPHHLIASFRATLEETVHADLLLHVVDISHPQAEQQLMAVNAVLKELDCNTKDVVLIFNKTDQALKNPENRSMYDTLTGLYPDALSLSARTGTGVDKLVDAVLSRLTGQKLHIRVTCSYKNGRVPNFLRAHGTILSESYNEADVILEATLGRRQLLSLQRLKPTSCDILLGDTTCPL